MENKEIVQRIEEISKIPNFCDMLEELAVFNKEYKKTSFFKKTKMPLAKLFESYRLNKLLTLKGIFASLQEGINSLDLSNINNLFDQISEQTQMDLAKGAEAIKGLNLEEILKNFGAK